MLPFKLAFSIILVSLGVVSAIIIVWTRPRPIKLDLNGEYEPLEGALDATTRDPFDILQPEDTIDGHPIESEKFWRHVRSVKFALYVIYSRKLCPRL